MKKKIIIKILLIIILLESVMPIKVVAFTEKKEITSISAQIEHQKGEDYVSETTGLDTVTGIILEPTVSFFSVIIDALMQIFTMCITQNDYEFVMVDNIDDIHDMGEPGATYTIESMEPYQNAFGLLDIKYPNFSYSPEVIFTGNLDLLDINFIEGSNQNTHWGKIRSIVASWYKVLRNISIIGLMSVLIYTGIKIIISSNSKDKAKYKERIFNWFIAIVLLFTMHYIMAFILKAIEEIAQLMGKINGVIEVTAGDDVFKTNLIGLARFQMQQQHFSAKIAYLVIYTALVTFTFKFTFVYLKRVLKMAFLTVIAPIVALTYPIDKMDGQAKGFNMWLKEYTYNALLQPMHYILYTILVSSSLSLAERNPIYAIAALLFISHAEKLLKKIFGFEKASGGTVGGLAGAYATGAVTSKLKNFVKNPVPTSSSGKGSSKNKDTNSYEEYAERIPKQSWEDIFDEFVPSDNVIREQSYLPAGRTDTESLTTDSTEVPQVLEQTDSTGSPLVAERRNMTEVPQVSKQTDSATEPRLLEQKDSTKLPIENEEIPKTSGINNLIASYRNGLKDFSIEELGGVGFKNNDNLDNILEQIMKYQQQLKNKPKTRKQIEAQMEQLRNKLNYQTVDSEIYYRDNGIPLQYIDGDPRTSIQLINDIFDRFTNIENLSEYDKALLIQQSQKDLDILKRRMAENNYMKKKGNIPRLVEREKNRMLNKNGIYEHKKEEKEKEIPEQEISKQEIPELQENNEQNLLNIIKNKPVVKGVTKVAKTIIKPAWDTEKGIDYNSRRLVGRIAGVAVGITATAVQAGISITDGKYNPLEGVATVGAGIVGASKIAQYRKPKQYSYEEKEKMIKEYGKEWYNREDVIKEYNKEYLDKGKEMRQRAVKNYISRGITDMNDQKKAIKYAERLKIEKGMKEDEADKIAVATLQYRETMFRDGSYGALYDLEERQSYLDSKAETYKGAASKEQVKKVHSEFILNVLDFDKANE